MIKFGLVNTINTYLGVKIGGKFLLQNNILKFVGVCWEFTKVFFYDLYLF